jgi:hypothetical protein
MAFTVNDLQDLIALLAEKPEWRAQLRPVILGEEFERMPQILQELAEAQRRTQVQMSELAGTVARLGEKVDSLAETVRSLTAQWSEDTGALYEIRFEKKAPSLFGSWLRKPRVISLNDIDQFEDAIDEQTLSLAEIEALRALDLMVVGGDREAPGRPETYFAVEISRTLDGEDVERAADRARILAKLGLRTRAAVGGKFASSAIQELAKSRGVEIRLLDSAG